MYWYAISSSLVKLNIFKEHRKYIDNNNMYVGHDIHIVGNVIGLPCGFIISPNEVFGDIMVLASPPRPPVDPDDVNTLTR